MDKLTNKEEEVMEYIWKTGPCSPKDIVMMYDDPKPHMNTIATMFQSLERKGYLTHRSQGRGYIYEPIVAQKDYGKSKFQLFIDRYFSNSYMNLVSTLVREEKVSVDELHELIDELAKKEAEGK